jgi:hypothetical protein
LYTTVITGGIFFLIIYLISQIDNQLDLRDKPIKISDFNTSNTVALVGLIITLIGALITNFIQVPLLDYEAFRDQ